MDEEKNWKQSLVSQLYSIGDKNSQNASQEDGDSNGKGFRWEELPLEVYETLIKFLDGNSVMNICHASPSIGQLVLEPVSIMSVEKRELYWNKFCVESVEDTFLGKIFCSFINYDMIKTMGNQDEVLCLVSWEDVFAAYQSFWKTLANSSVTVQGFPELGSMLHEQITRTRKIMKRVNNTKFAEEFVTRAGGRDVILNVMQPVHRKSKMKATGLVLHTKKTECIKTVAICNGGTQFFGVKIAYFPLIRPNNILDFEQVVVSVCNKCITFTSLFGKVTRKLYFPNEAVEEDTDEDDIFISESQIGKKCYVFEIYKNIVAVWNDPDFIKFMVITTIEGEDGYDLRTIYQLNFKGMLSTWNCISWSDCTQFLCEVQEFKGNTVIMNEFIKTVVLGGSKYLYPPKESTFYGLSIISPFGGFQSIKPKAVEPLDEYNATTESRVPQYYSGNARKYISGLKEKVKCSAKGFGMYVFCSNTTIAASWDGITWVFGSLDFPVPEGIEQNSVSFLQVMNHNSGLIFVVNEDIYIVDLIVKNNVQYSSQGTFLSEPELEIKLLRVFNTGLAPMYRELKHLELNFDRGQPFLLLVSEKERYYNPQNNFSVVMNRIDFLK